MTHPDQLEHQLREAFDHTASSLPVSTAVVSDRHRKALRTRRRTWAPVAAAAMVVGAVVTIAIVSSSTRDTPAATSSLDAPALPGASALPADTESATADTTVPSSEAIDTATSAAQLDPQYSDPPPWTYQFAIPAGDATVDMGEVSGTAVQLVKSSASICVVTSMQNVCEYAADPAIGLVGDNASVFFGGGSTSDDAYLSFWIAAPDVTLSLLDTAGASKCDMTAVAVPELGGAQVSMCKTSAKPDKATSVLRFEAGDQRFDLALG